MLMSARSVLENVKSRLRSRPAKRRNNHNRLITEHLEQRALLSTVSVIAGQLTYEADPSEMNRVRIRPLRNGAAYEITEEARLSRNQVDPFVRPGTDTPVTINVDARNLGDLTFSESSGSYGNRVVILDPERTITSVSIDVKDENDLVRVHTARVRRELGKYYLPVTVNAGDGNDAVVTGWGDDVVDGGEGHDHLFTNSGADYIVGGNGGDKIEGGYHDDTIEGNDGSDTIFGGHGNDLLIGGNDHDRIDGNRGDDTIDGGDGDDHLSGGWDSDLVIGGAGSDLVMAQWGRHGRSDNDTVIGGFDYDRDGMLDADDGETDVISVVQGDDHLQDVDASFADLRGIYVFNTGNMHHWRGIDGLVERDDWRDMTGREKREYWLNLRRWWNKDWSTTYRTFYSTTARF